MAKTERQRRSLKSDDFFFDSEAPLLDQQDFDMSSCAFNDVFNSKDSHMEQITFLKNVQMLLDAARIVESAERKDGSELISAAFLFYFIFFKSLYIFHLNFRRTKKITSLSTVSDNKGLSSCNSCTTVCNKHSLGQVCTGNTCDLIIAFVNEGGGGGIACFDSCLDCFCVCYPQQASSLCASATLKNRDQSFPLQHS